MSYRLTACVSCPVGFNNVNFFQLFIFMQQIYKVSGLTQTFHSSGMVSSSCKFELGKSDAHSRLSIDVCNRTISEICCLFLSVRMLSITFTGSMLRRDPLMVSMNRIWATDHGFRINLKNCELVLVNTQQPACKSA